MWETDDFVLKEVCGIQEQIDMDCLPLLSDRDLQMLGLTLAQRKLVLDAIANMGMQAESSTGIFFCLKTLGKGLWEACFLHLHIIRLRDWHRNLPSHYVHKA